MGIFSSLLIPNCQKFIYMQNKKYIYNYQELIDGLHVFVEKYIGSDR